MKEIITKLLNTKKETETFSAVKSVYEIYRRLPSSVTGGNYMHRVSFRGREVMFTPYSYMVGGPS